ncbi:DNA polymerase IV [Moorella sp. Hama-1]|uniref:DNA polymerase IV n=1 Tax=Moorella sp. Hama-1 TaxID=2138101 RepID=UPI00137B0AF8|nr:DNA polymerase IV [Moorella sp. Hama-1]BCV22199.1 DNA polymerase IV 1 [Moorella sp. Hama-1]
MRDILLCDLDAFFASVEQRDHPEYRGRPVIVGGDRNRGVVSTCSYAARRYGVHSAMPMGTALKLCPHAVVLPVAMARYKAVSRQIFAIFERYTPEIERVSIDEAYLALPCGQGIEAAQAIRRIVRAELDLPISIGISSNKLLAKMASELAKPDGLRAILPEDVPTVIWPLPVGKLPGVGPKTEKILQARGISTIGDLAAGNEDELARLLGVNGRELYRFAHGRDDRPLELAREPKSIGKEETFGRDIANPEELLAVLARLAGEVGYRLRRQGYTCLAVTLKLKRGDFTTYTRTRTLNTGTDDDGRLYQAAVELFHQSRVAPPWRLAGIQAAGLVKGFRQESLFAGSEEEKGEKLNKALDALREKYGRPVVRRAVTLKEKE